MKSVTFKPVIYEQYKRMDNTYVIRIRITFDRKHKYLTTNLTATKSQLTRSLSIKDRSLLDAVDNTIRAMRQKLQELNMFALQQMDIDAVVNYLLKSDENNFSLDFPTYAMNALTRMGAGAKNYKSAINSLTAFMGVESYDISVITSSLLVRWEQWLTDKHGKGARAISLYINSIAFLHQKARREFNDEELGIFKIGNPFSKYKAPKQSPSVHRNAPPALIQLMLLWRESLEGRERLGVDAFLISFALMGMNAPDMYEANSTKNNIIIYNRHKTRDRRADRAEMRVRIEPQVAGIMNEYKGANGKLFNFSVRYADFDGLTRAINLGLKQFATRIGLKTPLTLYVARHTWATIARSSACRIDKSIVNDCICHVDTGMRVTDIYAEKDWLVIWEANAKVLRLFNW